MYIYKNIQTYLNQLAPLERSSVTACILPWLTATNLKHINNNRTIV